MIKLKGIFRRLKGSVKVMAKSIMSDFQNEWLPKRDIDCYILVLLA